MDTILLINVLIKSFNKKSISFSNEYYNFKNEALKIQNACTCKLYFFKVE